MTRNVPNALPLPLWEGVGGRGVRAGRPPPPTPSRKGRGRTEARRPVAFLALRLSACMVGPDYHRPDAPVPVAYKELQGWTVAQPQDAADRGAWWSIYHDPELDRLERQVEVSNQTVKQFEAQYRNAVALVQEARASLFPTVGSRPAVTTQLGIWRRRRQRDAAPAGSFVIDGVAEAAAAHAIQRGRRDRLDPDVWGRVRRQVESQVATAQVNAADLANARLRRR